MEHIQTTPGFEHRTEARESNTSAVSWGAIIAGATGAAAIGLFLIVLGSGLGLSSVSAWSNEGASASMIGWSTVIWLTASQIIAAGLGGYLAGRLRTHWVSTHSDEVYFRDTAHGFLAWAVSVIITVVLLSTAATSILGSAGRAVASISGGATQVAALVAGGNESAGDSASPGFVTYYVNSLLRRNNVNMPTTNDAAQNAEEAARLTQEISPIVVDSLSRGEFSDSDKQYVAQLIAGYTGLSQQEAQSRIDSTITEIETRLQKAEDTAREAAEAARKAAAYTTLWIAISLLIGAFSSALLATFGGRLRDKA